MADFQTLDKQRRAEVERQVKTILRAMDFVSKHWLGRKRSGSRQAQLYYDIYQALGAAWHYYGLSCAHRKGYRKVSKNEFACRQCGHIKDALVTEYLLPVKGTKRIGRFVPVPRLGGKVRKNKRAAALVHDKILFHGSELSVDVHHAYSSRLFKSKISIAAGREVVLREGDVEVWIDDHLIDIRFPRKLKQGRTHRGPRKRPIYGAFPHELPKKALSKFPVIFSYDSTGRMEGVEIFRVKSKR